MEPVHIPGGPMVRVADQDPARRKVQISAHNAAMAAELVRSDAWPWFVDQCERKAGAFERTLLDRNRVLDPREEDRLRGEADAYRRMPRLIDETAAAHKRAVEKQQKKEQQS